MIERGDDRRRVWRGRYRNCVAIRPMVGNPAGDAPDMRPIVACTLAFIVTGCATTDPRLAAANIEANLPTNYKSLIVEHAKRDFFDPYSIRSAGISEPRSWGNLILVCVEANAKNKMGGYVGIQPTTYEFMKMELQGTAPNNPYLCPNDINYRPFPELETIK